ncbi:MAG TPA: flagellar protein FlgN [Bacillales bacterium]|nr:flagellar protein FlgN [Bacillales bacterium]
MSAEDIIETISDLVSVHRTLNEQAERKTETLKNGDMHGLESLLKEEERTAAELKSLEEKRLECVNDFLQSRGLVAEKQVTITQIADVVSQNEKKELLHLQNRLLEEMGALKQRNALNQELIEQSLHFINVTLNLASPPEQEPITYNRPNDSGNQGIKRQSLFDSKA